MKEEHIPYEKTIFVCTNAAEGKHCGNDGKGEKIFRALRNLAKERNLHPRFRVTQATCLGQCALGVNIMVYPENIWHNNVTIEDVPALAERYLR